MLTKQEQDKIIIAWKMINTCSYTKTFGHLIFKLSYIFSWIRLGLRRHPEPTPGLSKNNEDDRSDFISAVMFKDFVNGLSS